MVQSDGEDHDFTGTDAGASNTYPVRAGEVKKGSFVVIKEHPCKVGQGQGVWVWVVFTLFLEATRALVAADADWSMSAWVGWAVVMLDVATASSPCVVHLPIICTHWAVPLCTSSVCGLRVEHPMPSGRECCCQAWAREHGFRCCG